LGFIPQGMQNGFSFEAMMPDYSVGGIPEVAGYILSAVAGVAVLLIVFKIVSSLKKNTHGVHE
ncbi:MAG: cobalamin biosynthesis protein CbiM, partial [Ruminococcaceae bacterium]|nr:cobalamin biosynthesis protein CbiM [Oscillospiraceae bacterium]